jgi:hypothetical protein
MKNTYLKLAHFVAAFLLTMLPFQRGHALDVSDTPSVTQGDMVFFPGSLSALTSHDNLEQSTTTSNDMGWHMPSRQYRAGSDWWALVCDTDENLDDDKKGCKLHSTSLFVTKSKHGVYDSEPVDSQLLHWSPLPNNLDTVQPVETKTPALIALFKPIRSLKNLKFNNGEITTYVHLGMQQYPSTQRPGKLEVRLPLGDGRYADIVPRVHPTNLSGIATFELRIGKQRQQLPGYAIPAIEIDTSGMPQLRQQDYLLWAGDLDGDGKPDLIMDHGGDGIHVALYLSSLAKEGELVGLAGSFEYFDPSSAGC